MDPFGLYEKKSEISEKLHTNLGIMYGVKGNLLFSLLFSLSKYEAVRKSFHIFFLQFKSSTS